MLRDIRLALRTLRSWPLGAAIAIATLAIGIGTTTSLYAVVRAALGSTIGYVEDVDAVARIYASSRALGAERAQLTLADLEPLTYASSFESVGAYAGGDAAMTLGSQTVTVAVTQISSGFFPAMRARAASGRLLSSDEFISSAHSVVVSDRVWRTYFAGRSPGEAVLTLDGTPHAIVGVLPPDFGFLLIGIGGDVWTPLSPGSGGARRHVSLIARLKPGRSWAAAGAELASLARPQNPNGLWTWTAIPVQDDVSRRTRGGFAFMFGPAFVVLLIGCVNVACMLLARGIERDVELSVRSALGATRGRIVRQLLAEHLLLALIGGALGCAMAVWMLRAIGSALAQLQPAFALRLARDTTLLPVALAFSTAACVVFGTLPAVRLSRRDVASSLKGGTARSSARFVGYGARDLVVFVELGLAVVLVVVTAMWLTFFGELQRITPLFPADQVLATRVPAREAPRAAERVAALPGVSAVSIVSTLPGGRWSAQSQGQARANDRTARVSIVRADGAAFQTLGLPILRGRSFDAAESTGHAGVAVISERAAATLWPSRDPIGARLAIVERTGSSVATVIGVCRDALDSGSFAAVGLLREDIYLPLDITGAADVLLIARAATDARSLVRPMASATRLSNRAALPRVTVLGDEATFERPESVFMIRLLGGFGLIAMVLAATGIFGVVSQSVAQRTTEFGVRMAMGASRAQVLRMVLAREARLIAAAVATGAAGTVIVTKFVFIELLLISGTDPRPWIAVAVLCGGLAAAAALLATCRIVRLDPWVVLRRS